MTYVALSRGVAADRMKLRNFALRGVRVNKKWGPEPRLSPESSSSIEWPPRRSRFPWELREWSHVQPPPKRNALAREREEAADSRGEEEVSDSRGILPCSPALRKPFAPPGKRRKGEETADLEGWEALYARPFEKTAEVKPRNRIHEDMLRQAEAAKNREKAQLPAENVQNALLCKRMMARRQLLGGLL